MNANLQKNDNLRNSYLEMINNSSIKIINSFMKWWIYSWNDGFIHEMTNSFNYIHDKIH